MRWEAYNKAVKKYGKPMTVYGYVPGVQVRGHIFKPSPPCLPMEKAPFELILTCDRFVSDTPRQYVPLDFKGSKTFFYTHSDWSLGNVSVRRTAAFGVLSS